MTDAKQIIGVDIDGVLADQVTGVLDRVNAEHDLAIRYEDVIHWDVPLGPSSFVPEIKKAMQDPEYVLGMAIHPGAPEMLRELRKSFLVHLLTVRPPGAIEHTKAWLKESGLEYDDLVPAKEALKSAHGTSALVDDYPLNLHEFLTNSDGHGVLIQQPWNQRLEELEDWLSTPRLQQTADLRAVPALLTEALL